MNYKGKEEALLLPQRMIAQVLEAVGRVTLGLFVNVVQRGCKSQNHVPCDLFQLAAKRALHHLFFSKASELERKKEMSRLSQH